MRNLRVYLLILCTFALLLSSYLIWFRGGNLAWIGAGLSAALLLKLLLFPRKADYFIVPAALGLWGLSWPLVFYLVISGWESGEVVDIAIPVNDSVHRARVWILELRGRPVAFYDTTDEVIAALGSGVPITLTRGDVSSETVPTVTAYSAIDPADLEQINNLYAEKYGALNNWTTVYYSWLGDARNRTTVLIEF